jgi:hypothetical protein
VDTDRLVAWMLGRRSNAPLPTLDEFFAERGQRAWDRLCDAARAGPDLITDEVVEWASRRSDQAPGSLFAGFLNVAARDDRRRDELIGRCRRLAEARPGAVLGAAGFHFHEHNRLLDEEWLRLAEVHFDAHTEGAWGIFEAAAMYRPDLILPSHLGLFEARRSSLPRDYFVCLFSLAGHWPDRAEDLSGHALAHFSEHPSEAVDAAAFAARDQEHLLTPGLVSAVLAHFDKAPEKAWEFFEGACRVRGDRFDDALLDALESRTAAGPGTLLSILRHLMDAADRPIQPLMDRYVALVRSHPQEGIKSIHYDFQQEGIQLARRELVAALCEGIAANAYPAYEFLHRLIDDRPELIGPSEVAAAVAAIPHASNFAFGFFRDLLKRRPEFTRECAHALFECLAREPDHRAHVRAEQMESLMAIAEAAHVKTGLEKALAEPPRSGSRRARALMAVMFRQKLRARRHVLLEALRHAATLVMWRQAEGAESERFSPIWDFTMFIIDNASEDSISTAAAEQFLEGAFQIHYLCGNGAEHDHFLRNLDLGHPQPTAFPAGAGFLEADAELARLHRVVAELARRFEVAPRISPLEEFAGRLQAAEAELAAVTRQVATAPEAKRAALGERARNLEKRIACWRDPTYAEAFDDPAAEAALQKDAKALLRREKKDLAKHVRDALKAEAIRIAVAAVERSTHELYRNRLRDVLGRDVEIDGIEPKILPSFLWFPAIQGMENNTKALKRLIEDRIEGRPHDWLRSEPPALRWAERVRKGTPAVRIERWRAPFSQEFQVRPVDALAEKKRRIKADLAQARALLAKAGVKGIASASAAELSAALAALREPPKEDQPNEGQAPPRRRRRKAVAPARLEEIAMNLERVRIAEQTPDSDYEGKVTLSVETDPFEMLFMGEYGFASCLSLRGGNAWSAVSNAIDIDKAIVWAREGSGNVVGRRLLALTPAGVVTFRTYTNQHGLPLDGAFDEFIAAYAAHCGTKVLRGGGGKVGPLLSDRWYDDGAI